MSKRSAEEGPATRIARRNRATHTKQAHNKQCTRRLDRFSPAWPPRRPPETKAAESLPTAPNAGGRRGFCRWKINQQLPEFPKPIPGKPGERSYLVPGSGVADENPPIRGKRENTHSDQRQNTTAAPHAELGARREARPERFEPAAAEEHEDEGRDQGNADPTNGDGGSGREQGCASQQHKMAIGRGLDGFAHERETTHRTEEKGPFG